MKEKHNIDDNNQKKILYAAYGSNMLRERFLVYIKGGIYRDREYRGCTDKTEPEDCGFMFVPYRLYFAQNSPRWDNGGVAFLSCERTDEKELHALVRLWKINESQFEEILAQEGSWYHKILYLGDKDGYEVKTFTGCWENEINQLSEEYLEVIRLGIKETTGWDDGKIENYIKNFLID